MTFAIKNSTWKEKWEITWNECMYKGNRSDRDGYPILAVSGRYYSIHRLEVPKRPGCIRSLEARTSSWTLKMKSATWHLKQTIWTFQESCVSERESANQIYMTRYIVRRSWATRRLWEFSTWRCATSTNKEAKTISFSSPNHSFYSADKEQGSLATSLPRFQDYCIKPMSKAKVICVNYLLVTKVKCNFIQ